MPAPAVQVHRVSKTFRLYSERNQSLKSAVLKGRRSRYDKFLALDEVSMQVPTGTTFGIVGSNGSGKSTLLKCLARILIPNEGTIRTRGTVASLLELGSGFHPELTGRENVYLNASIMRIPRSEIDAKFKAIVDFAGIGTFIDQPVKNYSSGMYVRLGFAVAAHVDPDILLVDEVIAVGDAEFQNKCLQTFTDLRRRGRTVIVASHALGTVETLCDQVARLDHGQLVEIYSPADRRSAVGSKGGAGAAGALTPPGRGDASATKLITGLDIVDEHGFTVKQTRSGAAVTLRMRYFVEHVIDKPVFALELRTQQGFLAWGQHSRDADSVPEVLAGRGSIDLEIPRLALQAGVYEARAAVLDDSLGHVHDSCSFGSCLTVSNDSLTETRGLTVLGGRWGNAVHDVLVTGDEENV